MTYKSGIVNMIRYFSDEDLQFENEVYFKLQEAEREAELTDKRYSSKEVLKAMKEEIMSHCEYRTSLK